MITKNDISNLENEICNSLDVSMDLSFYNYPDSDPSIILSKIGVLKEKRNQGLGTKAMEMLIAYADQNNIKIYLTPVSDFGSTLSRLTKFYKSFGFVHHTVKNRDWHFKESMVRVPKLNKMNEELRTKIRKYCRYVVLKENDEYQIREFNKNIIKDIYTKNASEIFPIIMSYPDIWIQECGIETILNFLAKEDSMNFRPTIFKSDEPKYQDESEIEYFLRKNKIKYTLKEIKNRLVQYFIQGIYRNLPYDKKIETKEDFLGFLNTYKEAFLYGYIQVMAKI